MNLKLIATHVTRAEYKYLNRGCIVTMQICRARVHNIKRFLLCCYRNLSALSSLFVTSELLFNKQINGDFTFYFSFSLLIDTPT